MPKRCRSPSVIDTELCGDYKRVTRPTTKAQTGASQATAKHESSSQKSSHTARTKVRHITELLENIISFLPPMKIASVQRVSSRWRDTIAASHGIQTKLLFRLSDASPEVYEVVRTCPEHIDRLQQGRSTPWAHISIFGESLVTCQLDPAMYPRRLVNQSLVNPLMGRYGFAASTHLLRSQHGNLKLSIPQTYHLRYRGTFTSLKSCANMWLMDPPCYKVFIKAVISFRAMNDSPNSSLFEFHGMIFEAESANGLRIGDILEAISSSKIGLEVRQSAEAEKANPIPDYIRSIGVLSFGTAVTIAEAQQILQVAWDPRQTVMTKMNLEIYNEPYDPYRD